MIEGQSPGAGGDSGSVHPERKGPVQSEGFVQIAGGGGIPVLVLAFGAAWLATKGYPLFWLGSVGLLATGARGLYLAVAGGVVVSEESVEARGWLGRTSMDRERVCYVLVRVGRSGRPSGWLVANDLTEMPLRGATWPHSHDPIRGKSCLQCGNDAANLSRIAAYLGVQVIQDGKLSSGPFSPA